MKLIIFALLLFSVLVFGGCYQKENKNLTMDSENFKKNEDYKTNQETIMKYNEEKIVLMKTNLGDIKIKLFTPDAPKTVDNFLKLAESDFYNGTLFHRVIKGFMIQGGDPLSKEADWSIHGTGGPGYAFEDEFNNHKLVKGSLAMANSGPDTNGSQFFIVTAPETAWLDGRHTNFGEVIEGMEIVDKIEAVKTDLRDHPIENIVVEKIEIISEN